MAFDIQVIAGDCTIRGWSRIWVYVVLPVTILSVRACGGSPGYLSLVGKLGGVRSLGHTPAPAALPVCNYRGWKRPPTFVPCVWESKCFEDLRPSNNPDVLSSHFPLALSHWFSFQTCTTGYI